MAGFDWHAAAIPRATPVTESYRSAQNVRRFMVSYCGADFAFDRPFMAWIKDGTPRTMADVVDVFIQRRG